MELGVKDGKFYKRTSKGETVEIPGNQYYALQFAGESSPAAAGAFKAADRYANVLDKFGVDTDRDNPQYQNMKNALQQQHPKSTMAGDVVPYMAGPASMYSTIPRAMASGGGMGYLFSNEGEAFADTALGTALGPTGNMAGRVLERITPFSRLSGSGGPSRYKKPMETTYQKLHGKQGFEGRLANTAAGAGPANLFGRTNQIRLNQLVADSIGLDGKQIRRIRPAMMERVTRDLATEIDEVNRLIKNTPQTDVNARATLRRRKLDAQFKVEAIGSAKEALDASGNISIEGIYKGNKKIRDKMRGMVAGNYEQIYKNSGFSGPQVTELANIRAGEYMDKRLGDLTPVMERVDELTDPQKNLFFSGGTKAEELIANVFRGLSPLGGIESGAMFASSMAPIGVGGQIGSRAGVASPGIIDSKQDQLSNDLYNWYADQDRGLLDKAGDVGETALKTGGAGLLGYGARKAGQKIIKDAVPF